MLICISVCEVIRQSAHQSLRVICVSQGRLPLNDKGINDALENCITSCLRSLQRTNPSLLLTAHQLKRVERDSKYVPSVASAIASVLCRSRKMGLFEHTMKMISGWDDDVRSLGIAPFDQPVVESAKNRNNQLQRNLMVRADQHPEQLAHDRERMRIEALAPILERRLRFVVSEEFKDFKKLEEKERKRQERKEEAADRKRLRALSKKKKSTESDVMKGDCFESDDSDEGSRVARHNDNPAPKDVLYNEFDSEISSSDAQAKYQYHRHYQSSDVKVSEHGFLRSTRSPGKRSPVNHASSSVGDVLDCNDGFESESVSPAKCSTRVDMSNLSHDNIIAAVGNGGLASDDEWSRQFDVVVPGS